MDTKEPKSIADGLHHNWELGSGGAGPITLGTYSPQQDLLSQMSANLKTQDNLRTAEPIYIVYEKLMIVGLEDGYSDFWAWITDDSGEHEEADSDLMKVLDNLLENDEPLIIGSRTYRRIGCKYVDKFASAFFTRKAAEEYIECNGHHLEQPFIFVESLDRNPELAAVRKYFMSKGAEFAK